MKIRAQRSMIAALVVAAGGVSFISAASAQGCRKLWAERNSYYKQAGYCFKTTCRFPIAVPFSRPKGRIE